MAYNPINLGSVDGDKTGDKPKPAGAKINAMFSEVYSHVNSTNNPHGVTASQVNFTPAGTAGVVRSLQTKTRRSVREVDVQDFGATGDGVTNDGPAINAALNYIRSELTTVSSLKPWRLVLPTALYKTTETLNFSGLTAENAVVDGEGSNIIGAISGGMIIDAFKSRYIRFKNLRWTGDATTTPAVGLAFGRVGSTATNSADNHEFHGCGSGGNFSLAALYNNNAETVTFNKCHFYNSSTATTSYTVIQDGINHFGVQSAYLTGEVAPVDTAQSFNENTFQGCIFGNNGGRPILWMSQCGRHRYDNCYAAITNSGTDTCAVEVYSQSDSSITNFHFGCHVETDGIKDIFFFTGPHATPIVQGFGYEDNFVYASRSIVRCDTPITTLRLRDVDFRLASFNYTGCLIFNEASKIVASGSYRANNSTQWNNSVPAQWRGLRHVGDTYGWTMNGANGLTFGQGNTANFAGSIAMGQFCSTGNVASMAIGNSSTANGAYSFALGNNALDGGRTSVMVMGGGGVGGVQGTQQLSLGSLWRATTTATATALTSTGGTASGTNAYNLPINATYWIRGRCVARQTGGTAGTAGDSAAWQFTALIRKGANAAATTLIGATYKTAALAEATAVSVSMAPMLNDTGAAAWRLAIAADTTNGGIAVTATGEANKNISWECFISAAELQG